MGYPRHEKSGSKMHPDRQRMVGRQAGAGKPPPVAQRHTGRKKNVQAARKDEAALEKGISGMKKRLRDLGRELSHKDGMPMTLRQNKERELDGLRLDLELALRRKAKNQRISRYHHARFFERQKATRILKRAQKTAAAETESSPTREESQALAHEAEVNLNYTIYSPLLEKYVSLWSKDGPGSGFKSTTWYLVEAAMATGRLQELRDRMTDDDRKELDNLSGIGKWNNLVNRVKKGTASNNSNDDLDENNEMDDGEEGGNGDSVIKGTGGFFGR